MTLSRIWEPTVASEPALLADARSAGSFGTCYIALLLEVRDTLQRGLGQGGAPAGRSRDFLVPAPLKTLD